MNKIKSFLDRKIVTKDVGEETYITWREALSYAMGRGAQGMSTSMTASKYVNFFITDVLHIKARHASNIRLYCGIFDAINDPIMGVIVDKTRTKYGKMRPYIKFAPYFVSLFMLLFFIGNDSLSYGAKIALTVFAFVGLDVTYTAFDVPMGALAFSMTPNGTERTKLYGVASIGRMILGAIPAGLVAFAAWLPYFNQNLDKAYLVAAAFSAFFIILFTRFTFKNTTERLEHHEEAPSLKECLHLLATNRPLLMLFLGNIFFVIIKVFNKLLSVKVFFCSFACEGFLYHIVILVILEPDSYRYRESKLLLFSYHIWKILMSSHTHSIFCVGLVYFILSRYSPCYIEYLSVKERNTYFKAVCHAHLVGLKQNITNKPEVDINVLHFRNIILILNFIIERLCNDRTFQ